MKREPTSFSHNRGFTLMELMVYIAIMGIIVLVAGQAFSNSTKMRVRTQSMIKATEIAENVGTLIKDDVAQMGAKSAIDKTTHTFVASEAKDIYMDPDNSTESKKDSSSFRIVNQGDACPENGCTTDTLALRRIRYNTNGNREAEEEVKWFFAQGKLFRSCRTLPPATGTDECNSTGSIVEVAESVADFKVIPAKPGVLSADYSAPTAGKQFPRLLPSNSDTSIHAFTLVPRTNEGDFYTLSITPTITGEQATLTNFTTNYDFEQQKSDINGKKANQVFVAPAGESIGSWNDLCTQIDSLVPGYEYEISFHIPFSDNNNSRTFRPNEDHMAVGFRYTKNGKKPDEIDDFLFYPPTNDGPTDMRNIRFSVPTKVTEVCLAFTFVFYSPLASSGSITIRDVQLNRVESTNYEFDPSWQPSPKDKQNVKAFKIELAVNKNGETGNLSLVIPTPSNGPRD